MALTSHFWEEEVGIQNAEVLKLKSKNVSQLHNFCTSTTKGCVIKRNSGGIFVNVLHSNVCTEATVMWAFSKF